MDGKLQNKSGHEPGFLAGLKKSRRAHNIGIHAHSQECTRPPIFICKSIHSQACWHTHVHTHIHLHVHTRQTHAHGERCCLYGVRCCSAFHTISFLFLTALQGTCDHINRLSSSNSDTVTYSSLSCPPLPPALMSCALKGKHLALP